MYLIQTVQTTWRPQLPLPKELQLTDEQHSADDTKLNTRINADNNYENSNNNHNHNRLNKVDDDSLEMERMRNSNNNSGSLGSSQQLTHKQKWSFGRLFRKKKDVGSGSSSEEDRKAGFVPAPRQLPAKTKANGKHGKMQRAGNSSKALTFDHIVLPSQQQQHHQHHHIDNEFFLPVETLPQEPYYQNQQQYQQQQPYSRSTNSLDRRLLAAAPALMTKSRSAQRSKAGQSSGEEAEEPEMISLNSSTFSKYRSDESIHSGGQAMQAGPGQSRRSRAARNERYYKRLSRDGEQSHGGVPAQQPAQRWKTQPVPLSIYQPPPQQQQPVQPRLRNTSSLQNMQTPAPAPYVQWHQLQQQQQQRQQPARSLQNTLQQDGGKRSISYDSHIHLQNANGRLQSKPLPPPPPPRDPLRRVHVANGSSSSDLRPVSYAFDQCGVPALGLGSRCLSDDRIWQPQVPLYQSVHSLNITPNSSVASAPAAHAQHRRYITRAERDAQPGKKSLPNGIDFHYVADATPRSRKPIHMLEATAPPSSGLLRTSKSGLPTPQPPPSASQFWQRLDEGTQRLTRAASMAKPRSISSSRVNELRSYEMPMYSEVQKPKRAPPITRKQGDEVDNVICGSLHIKPSAADKQQNYVEIRHRDAMTQQRRSGELSLSGMPNKYDEYVAEKREQHQQAPPLISFPRKKPANLEEAINELEAIYKSLGLTEPPEAKSAPAPASVARQRVRVPTPSDFEKYALAHADEYDDEDSPGGEPDPVRDDVAYRNQQLANLQHRSAEKQPPFGIPVGPIVPAPQSDYLHVEPVHVPKKTGSPDIVKDDLAVRALRKDPPGAKPHFVYPAGALQKKHRATRTQSANIYNLIQRDAAKPSGGDLHSFMELTRKLERAGSLSDLQHEANDTSDIPATLDLLRKLKAQDEEAAATAASKKPHIPFRHPSQVGAIAQLPERLNVSAAAEVAKTPVPLPRTSLTPEPIMAQHQMEDALNKIAQDAEESSIKLSQELQELRKGALITAARPKLNAEQQKLELELQEIEAVSEAAKRCGKMLLETLPDAHETETEPKAPNARKLHEEGKLIKAIDQVSEAANAVCDKILKDIVTTEPPVIVHEAVQVKQATEPPLVMPMLIKQMDPIQSDKIEAIAKRCMRQLSELAETADYDNLQETGACNVVSTAAGETSLISTVAEVAPPMPRTRAQAKAQTLEEIDKIMEECERQVRHSKSKSKHSDASTDDQRTTAPSMTSSSGSGGGVVAGAGNAPQASTTASSFSSSSDCLAKSSSPTNASRPLSSSITSFNPYSSSDYIKSPSSDYHALSTDPIKTFSTTSYDVQSTTSAATPNICTSTNTSTTDNQTASASGHGHATSTQSPSPSPPLNLTPVTDAQRAQSSSPSQYNSSEELAAIFGIEQQPRQRRQSVQPAGAASTGKGSNDTQAPSANTSKNMNMNMCHNRDAHAHAATTNTTNPSCCPNASLAQALNATNNVLNVEVDVDNDVTTMPLAQTLTNASASSSSSSASNPSYKLATIPEQEHEPEASEMRPGLKLSPNFNRIYASKIDILVDKTQSEPNMATQLDSLSSLEETSSNPDSGNVSLTDFPLAAHANASIELQTVYNSRFEVREHYVSEVSIDANESSAEETETESKREERCEDFPRLPTEQELLESLREREKDRRLETRLDETVSGVVEDESKLSQTCEESRTVKLDETEDTELLQKEEIELDERELDKTLNAILVAESELEQATFKPDETVDIKLDELDILSEEVYDLSRAVELQKEQFQFDESELNEHELDEILSADMLAESKLKLATDKPDETVDAKLDESELDEKLSAAMLAESKLKLATYKLDETVDAKLNELGMLSEEVYDLSGAVELQKEPFQLDESELDEADATALPLRRKSVVFETPQINLSITELKLNYETKVERIAALDEGNEQGNSISSTSACNEPDEQKAKQKEANESAMLGGKGLPAGQQRRLRSEDDDEQQQPTSSRKTLSVFGELRPAAFGGGGGVGDGDGATSHSLTTLEHVLVACTVGLITPNDLLTLCLIVIGVIIIIAIALA